MKYLYVVEYGTENKWYLTIGHNSPWNNFHIRINKRIGEFLLKKGIAK